VSAYEYAKGQYVVVDTAELVKLRTEADKSVQIDAFVANEKVDPLYFRETSSSTENLT
jgi:non-homologous end joining protein Ku